MSYVVTLVNTTPHGLPKETVEIACQVIQKHAHITSILWLSPHKACDIFFALHDKDKSHDKDKGKTSALHKDLKKTLTPLPLDWMAQPNNAQRKKRLLAADMESTIIAQECLDGLAHILNKGTTMASITKKAMNDEIPFIKALQERVAMLRGTPLSLLKKFHQEHITFTPGAQQLVATMKAYGAITALITGGFTVFAHKVGEDLGFAHVHANTLDIKNGTLTGEITPPILAAPHKAQALQSLAQEFHIPLTDTMAIGDGANDAAMLRRASLGVAYHGKPPAQSAADISLNHCDLRGALYIQGYSDLDIKKA